MATLRVNPTRMELTRIKRRLVTAKRGHKLLKDKRDEMVRRFILLVRENHRLRIQVEEELSGALKDFAMARAVMNPQMLEEAVMYPARKAEVLIGKSNIMSVEVPTIQADAASLEKVTLPYGLAETSSQLDGAIAALAAVLPKLLQLAETEKTCNLLADEIEKTRRRVNALEYVMIPQFEETIRYITMKLDENERSSLTRLMKVKEMIAQREEVGA
ncbi:MAG: V-type ATP synthase subunit D [Clostridiales bacterium]|nr:V-type ATP synthase subunit D [Clostridiales bacterium]